MPQAIANTTAWNQFEFNAMIITGPARRLKHLSALISGLKGRIMWLGSPAFDQFLQAVAGMSQRGIN